MDWIQLIGGFIGGVIATTIGVWQTMGWEQKKDKEKKKVLVQAFILELITNLELLSANCIILEEELDSIKQGSYTLHNLGHYRIGTWDMLKVDLPENLTNREIIIKIQMVIHLIDLINRYFDNRENFKINNHTLGNITDILEKYDRIILEMNQRLCKKIKELAPILNFTFVMKSKAKILSGI